MSNNMHTFRLSLDSIIDPRSHELAKQHETAPKASASDLTFIQGLPGSDSIRDVELEQAKAKAHVSKLLHRRRRMSDQFEPTETRLRRPSPAGVEVSQGSPSYRYQRQLQPKPLQRETPRPQSSLFSDDACSGGLRVDPFYSTPFSRSRDVVEVFDWYRVAVIPRLDMQSKSFGLNPWLPFSVPSLAEDTMFFHASFAVIGLMFDRRAGAHAQPSDRVLRHRGLALSMIRQYLRQDTHASALTLCCAIVFLAIFEVMVGNIVAYQTHADALRVCLSLLRSASSSQMAEEKRCRAITIQFDLFRALISGDDLFPPHRKYRKPLPWTPLAFRQLSKLAEGLPDGFRNLASSGELYFDTTEVLCRVILGLTCPDRQDRQEKEAAARIEDQEACPYLFRPGTAEVTLDKLILLAMTIRTFLDGDVMITAGLIAARNEVSRRATSYAPCTKAGEEALTWVFVTALEAWHIHDPDLRSPQAHRLIEHLRDRLAKHNTDAQSLLTIMQRFDWQPFVGGNSRVDICRAIARAGSGAVKKFETFVAYQPKKDSK